MGSTIGGGTTTQTTSTDPELLLAFERAKKNTLTSARTLTGALLTQPATRFTVAKFMTQYITQVEKKTVPARAACDVSKYTDFNQMDADQATYIQSACQL